jgi:hypothetical protein
LSWNFDTKIRRQTRRKTRRKTRRNTRRKTRRKTRRELGPSSKQFQQTMVQPGSVSKEHNQQLSIEVVKKWLHPYTRPEEAQEHPEIHMARGLRPVASNREVASNQQHVPSEQQQYPKTSRNEELDINVQFSL